MRLRRLLRRLFRPRPRVGVPPRFGHGSDFCDRDNFEVSGSWKSGDPGDPRGGYVYRRKQRPRPA